jgi:hypothetical protein
VPEIFAEFDEGCVGAGVGELAFDGSVLPYVSISVQWVAYVNTDVEGGLQRVDDLLRRHVAVGVDVPPSAARHSMTLLHDRELWLYCRYTEVVECLPYIL